MDDQPVVDRREIRERLDRTRRYWVGPNGTVSTGAMATEIITLLAEKGIKVVDSDFS